MPRPRRTLSGMSATRPARDGVARALEAPALGNVGEQVLERVGADGAQHLAQILLGYGRIAAHRGGTTLATRLEQLLVCLDVEQGVDLGGVAEAHLDHPAVPVGILIDLLRLLLEAGVDLDDL